LSRGHGEGDLKNVRKQLGGFATLAEAEERIKHYVAEIEKHGPDHMPGPDEKKESKHTIRLMAETSRIRALRKQGHTMREIAEKTGFCEATIHKVTTDMGIDRRKG
jgi:DNA-binding NarL/FixJ family response regulator